MYTRLDLKMVTDGDQRRKERLDSTPWQGETQIRTPTAKAASSSARFQIRDGQPNVYQSEAQKKMDLRMTLAIYVGNTK